MINKFKKPKNQGHFKVVTMIVAILFLFAVDFSFGHVSLTFPPARRLDLDFLDTFR